MSFEHIIFPCIRPYASGRVLFLSALLAAMPVGAAPARAEEGTACVPVGSWVVPGAAEVAGRDVITRAARNAVLLLGETHDNPEHHRWQLQTLAALHALRPDMVIGFEMFPRRVQPALDRWVAGELSESQFLDAVDWGVVWSTDATLYLPLFHFARMNRIPMAALNIDTRLRRAVSQKGFDAIPEAEREGVTPPAVPGPAYLDYLLPFYREHVRDGKKRLDATRDDPDFRRFVEAQQLWDRAMAQALHAALAQPNRPLVVGVMGSGHIRHGYGVAHQLRDLGVPDVGALLPWNSGADCGQVVGGLADAVFGVAPPLSVPPGPPRQRLGIRFEWVQGGARVLQVEKGSIAEAAGVRDGDVILEAAGVAIGPGDDIAEIVRRQAPGTWLPLKLKRSGGGNVEVVAKFPALPR